MNSLISTGNLDISEITLGLLKDGGLTCEETHQAQPEAYLREINSFLSAHEISLDELEAVAVVTGPGSFTASRVSVTIANTIGFTKSIPIIPIENKEKKSLSEIVKQIDLNAVPNVGSFALPVYDRPPGITTPKSDTI